MSYFPFFKEIAGQRVLIVGGGEVGLRRAQTLIQFGAEIVCVAPEFCEGFSKVQASKIARSFLPSDILPGDVVIASANDPDVNEEAAAIARELGCEVCVCDAPEKGTFHFPAVVRRGGMSIGISSDGASPSASKFIRERIEETIPETFSEVLDSMEIARSMAKEMLPDQKVRSRVLRRVFEECLNAPHQPDIEALKAMIRCFCGAELD